MQHMRQINQYFEFPSNKNTAPSATETHWLLMGIQFAGTLQPVALLKRAQHPSSCAAPVTDLTSIAALDAKGRRFPLSLQQGQ